MSDVNIIISATDKTKSAFSSVGGAIGKLGKVAAGAAIGGLAALGAGLAFSVKAAMEAEEIQAQLAAVLKSTGGAAGLSANEINDMALSLSKVTRYEDDAIVAGQNVLLTFTKIGKDVFPQATEAMLDMSTALGQDMQSSAIQLGKALNDPVQGMTALRRVGVSFTDAQVDMVKAMVDAGDMMGAQKFILQELQTEFGGSAMAAGETFAGQLDILKNNLGNVGESIGGMLLPVLTNLTSWVNEKVVPGIEWFVAAIQEAGLFSVEVADVIAEYFGQNAAQAFLRFGEAVGRAKEWVINVLVPALQDLWSFVQTNLIPIFQTAYNWLQTNLPTAIATVTDFWNNTLLPALNAIWDFIKSNVIPIFETIGEKMSAEMPGAMQTLVDFWNSTLSPALTAMWTFLTEDMKPIWEALGLLIGTTVVLAFEALKLAWELVLKPALDAVWALIQDYVLPAFQSIAENETLKAWIDTVAGAIQTLVGWLQTAVTWFQNLSTAKANSDAKGVTPGKGYGGVKQEQFGGPVWAGQPYMVGERGPELFVPHTAGSIVNNWNLTINEAGQRGNVVMDFEIMKALARA